jgi:hypothetical protein
VRDSVLRLSTLRCDICDGRGSISGLLRCGGSSGGMSSFRVKFELALLCAVPGLMLLWAVPGLRPFGDVSFLDDGYPFCRRGSGGAMGGAAPSNDGSSKDLSDS